MPSKKLKELKKYSTIGKEVRYTKKGSNKIARHGQVLDEVSQIATDDPEYKFFIQKIKWDGQKELYFRICYYTLTAKRNKLKFAQFAPGSNKKTLKRLFDKARKKGFF